MELLIELKTKSLYPLFYVLSGLKNFRFKHYPRTNTYWLEFSLEGKSFRGIYRARTVDREEEEMLIWRS